MFGPRKENGTAFRSRNDTNSYLANGSDPIFLNELKPFKQETVVNRKKGNVRKQTLRYLYSHPCFKIYTHT